MVSVHWSQLHSIVGGLDTRALLVCQVGILHVQDTPHYPILVFTYSRIIHRLHVVDKSIHQNREIKRYSFVWVRGGGREKPVTIAMVMAMAVVLVSLAKIAC